MKLKAYLDLGTTTLALAVKGESGAIKYYGGSNPQTLYGSDVMSRVALCVKDCLGKLNGKIIEGINALLERAKEDFPDGEITCLQVSGNTVMLHLLLNTDCSSMGVYPYTPAFLDEQCVEARSLGLCIEGKVVTLPCVAAFVGSDITAGLLTVAPPTEKRCKVFIDLGTNAETALILSDEILTTSAACGPVFEGGSISCGMRAKSGAIDSLNMENGSLKYTVIGDYEPIGLCGSGIIDTVAVLLKNGVIDKSGAFKKDDAFFITDKISLTQKDVREFQTAKSAVRSGIEILLSKSGADYSDVEELIVAGGFGDRRGRESLIAVGILPDIPSAAFSFAGNTSLQGNLLCSDSAERAKAVVERCSYVDLATSTEFFDAFIGNLNFQ